MKILYNIPGTYRPAGMERVLAEKANWLAARGHEITIVTTEQRGRGSAFALDAGIKCVDLGIDYELNNGASLLNKLLKFPFKQLRHRRRLSAYLKANPQDICISMFGNEAGFVPALKDGSRKILEIHFSRFKRLQYGRNGLWGAIDRLRSRNDARVAARYDAFVVLTLEDAGYWGEMPNIKVIPNPSTFSFDAPADPANRTVLASGRYSHQKGFERLIEAWKMIDTSGWTLRIAGSGDPTADGGVPFPECPANIMLGPSNDMRREYLNASIFALSSRYEGLPMVLLEAQAAGLPIVSFACQCGPRDIVHEGKDGFLVPEGDIPALAAKIKQLMDDEGLRRRMGQAAFEASPKYDLEVIMQRWLRLFDDVGDPSASPQDDERELQDDKRKTVVVSAVNLRKGGTLTILRSCLKYLSENEAQRHRIIALVHDRALCDYPGIEYIEFPNTIKSWRKRLWCEYVTMHKVSRQIAKEDGRKVWMWLSLHDTTPWVEADHRQVYCHTSFPFLKLRWRDFLMDPKIPLFAMFTRVAYRINIHKNEHIIVQQNWFRDAMSRMLKVPAEKFRVIPPSMPSLSDVTPAEIDSKVPMFLYASTADCHKNFEILCDAARLLEQEIGQGRFRLVLTVKGDENRYARWLYKHWGTVESIDFHGFMDKAQLFGHYKAAHCLVFPSRVETWGLPISEYIALGNGRMLLADLPYAHESAAGAAEVKFFDPDNVLGLKKLMKETLRATPSG